MRHTDRNNFQLRLLTTYRLLMLSNSKTSLTAYPKGKTMDDEMFAKARADLFSDITRLMEKAYELGYSDGREDAQFRHKQFVMETLMKEKH